MNVTKYIGIPYKYGEDGYGGTDCLGLCRLFYQEHQWKQTFRDGKPQGTLEDKGQGFRLARYLTKHFTRIEQKDLQYGDILIFNVLGDPHLGIYIENGDILAMQVPCNEMSRSMIYHKRFWQRAFVGAYRR